MLRSLARRALDVGPVECSCFGAGRAAERARFSLYVITCSSVAMLSASPTSARERWGLRRPVRALVVGTGVVARAVAVVSGECSDGAGLLSSVARWGRRRRRCRGGRRPGSWHALRYRSWRLRCVEARLQGRGWDGRRGCCCCQGGEVGAAAGAGRSRSMSSDGADTVLAALSGWLRSMGALPSGLPQVWIGRLLGVGGGGCRWSLCRCRGRCRCLHCWRVGAGRSAAVVLISGRGHRGGR